MLLDRLKSTGTAAEPARVVAVASIAQYAFSPPSGIFFDDLAGNDYNQWSRYGQSKLANLLMANELQRRMQAEGAHVVAVTLHPGVVRETKLERYSNMWANLQMFTFWNAWSILFQMRTIPEGAGAELMCAFHPNIVPGGYYYDGHLETAQVHPTANDPAVAQRLWTVSEELVSKAGLA